MKDIVVSWDTASKTQCLRKIIFNLGSVQIRNKNYKNLSKRNFALSKIDNFYEYFLPIFVIFIEQIIVRKIETSGSHSGYRIDLSFFCPLIMIEVSRFYMTI
jgi:hypothetical protein